MSIKVKSYNRRSKKGITIVNSFVRKGDKKTKQNNTLKKIGLGLIGGTAILGAALLLKKKSISVPMASNIKTVNKPKFNTVPDPWTLPIDVNPKTIITVNPVKKVSVNPVKLISPGAEPSKPLKPPFLGMEGKQFFGIKRSHGKLRTVHRGETVWDEQLIKDKPILELARSTDISDRQRAVAIFKQKKQERLLARKFLKKNRQVSLNIEKTVSSATKKQVNVNTNNEQTLRDFIDKVNKKKTAKPTKQLNVNSVIQQVKDVKDIAEGATIKKIKGTRRDLLTAFIPKLIEESKPTTEKLKTTAQQQYAKGKKIIDANAEALSDLQKEANQQLEKVKQQLEKTKQPQESLKATIKQQLDKNNPLRDIENLAPNEVTKNLIKSGKKEAKKLIEIKAIDAVNPLAAKAHYIKEDVKGRLEQVERYAKELDQSGNTVLDRRQLFKTAVRKTIKEASKKPKDGFYVGKGTVTKSRDILRRLGVQDQEQVYNADVANRYTLRNSGNPLQVYYRSRVVDYRPARGLLEKWTQAGRRFLRYKSGDIKAIRTSKRETNPKFW